MRERSVTSGITALVVGRFQPFHHGHLKVMVEVLENVGHIIIGIGSAQYSGSVDNPFSYEERKTMIEKSMKMESIDASRYSIHPIDDIHDYPKWVAHVKKAIPHFDLVYTRSDLTKRLFTEAGMEIREPSLYDRERYSGTGIRRRMIHGEKWRELVPTGTGQVIDSVDGVSRLKNMVDKEGPI